MQIENLTLDSERALYGLRGAEVKNCTFEGPADGESALKECREISVTDCHFALRYPLWHVHDGLIRTSFMSTTCRAPLWYGKALNLQACRIEGVKAVRECSGVVIEGCEIDSEEFGWKSQHLTLRDTSLTSQYAFLDSSDLTLEGVEFSGKYAFQYTHDVQADFCTLRAKDAFWHAKDVTLTDCIIEGEYLGWYSENLTLRHCVISGTQPFAYCKNLVLEDCVMEESCDLAFERSQVDATIRGNVTSIKNPKSGTIQMDSVKEIIRDAQEESGSSCTIIQRKPQVEL